MVKEKKFWIDALKAICMLGVYICHSEAYSGYHAEALGYWVRPFYVNAFFFVSGYLFFAKWLNCNDVLRFVIGGGKIVLQNLLFRLVWPTLLFSSLIYIPKILFHDGHVEWTGYLIDVFGGISYWFTSALVVAQLLLLVGLMLMNGKSMRSYVAMCIILFLLGTWLNGMNTDDGVRSFFPWFYKTGMEYTLVMACGGLYRIYENMLSRSLKYIVAGAAVAYVAILSVCWKLDYTLMMLGLGGRWNLWGLMTVACGIVLIVAISKRIPPK
jgi:fucose 4-O-acetylase-like acetyltransferase